MKRILVFLTSLAMILSLSSALARTGGAFKYEIRGNGTVKVTGYTGSETVIEIPAELDGKKVTEIDRAAFEGNVFLTEVTVPETVISLGTNPFKGCTALQRVYVAKGNKDFTAVDGVLFSKDGHLLICYPSAHEGEDYSVPDGTRNIGASAFYRCSALKRVSLPGTVTVIGSSAFYGCAALTEVFFPEGLTTLGASAFRGCVSLTEIILPASMKTVGTHAFDSCASLISADIPGGVTAIGSDAFYGCTGLTLTVSTGSRAARYAKAKGIRAVFRD